MSVTAMAQTASTPARRSPAANESPAEKAIRTVATYIPSEAVATYIALLGLLVPAPGTPEGQVFAVKMFAFGVGLLLAIGLVFVAFKRGTNDTDASAWRKRLLLVGFAVVAFIAYSVATPGGPWAGAIAGIALTVWGAAIAIILAIVMPILAQLWGLRPS